MFGWSHPVSPRSNITVCSALPAPGSNNNAYVVRIFPIHQCVLRSLPARTCNYPLPPLPPLSIHPLSLAQRPNIKHLLATPVSSHLPSSQSCLHTLIASVSDPLSELCLTFSTPVTSCHPVSPAQLTGCHQAVEHGRCGADLCVMDINPRGSAKQPRKHCRAEEGP